MSTSININYAHILLVTILLIAAATDIKSHRIPNWLSLPTMVIAIVYYSVSAGASGLGYSIAGTAAGIGLMLIPYLMGGMGAGDAKLMGAVGSLVGAKGVFVAFLFTAIAGGLYALLFLLVHRSKFKGFFRNLYLTLQLFILTRKYVPDSMSTSQAKPKLSYGVAIALGSITYIVLTQTGYLFPI